MGFLNSSSRWILFHWVGWFFFINSILAFITILGYLPQISSLMHMSQVTIGNKIFAYAYFVLAFFTQISLYMFLCAFVCVLVAAILPYRWPVMILSATLSAILLCAIIIETIVFRLYHMHYALIGWKVIQAHALAQVMPLGGKEKFIASILVLALMLVEVAIAAASFGNFTRRFKRAIKVIVLSVVSTWFVLYASFGLANAQFIWREPYKKVIVRVARITPYLSQIYQAFFEHATAVRELEIGGVKSQVIVNAEKKQLTYPLRPLSFLPVAKKMNVVIIGIDAWRYSAMTKKITPNIYAFSKKSIEFKNHFSGGNCTGPGIFSLFYSLPPNYWDSFLLEKRSPVLIDALQQAGFEIKAFLSAQSNFPQFDKTVFVNLKSLKKNTFGNSSMSRDRAITKEFISFLKNRHRSKPFFSFIFYDTLHNYCEPDRPTDNLFAPAVKSCDRFSLSDKSNALPYLNLYYNKAYFVDGLVGKVLSALKKNKLLKNTIVMITADHGEQMNDVGMGLWGHASSYSTYQLHVPMILYWPGKLSMKYTLQTTHYDIVPTLMTGVLGCQNKSSDYGVGHSLFLPHRINYFIAGSYGDYAILHANQVLRIYPDGDYQVADMSGHSTFNSTFNQQALKEALHDLQRFFRH